MCFPFFNVMRILLIKHMMMMKMKTMMTMMMFSDSWQAEVDTTCSCGRVAFAGRCPRDPRQRQTGALCAADGWQHHGGDWQWRHLAPAGRRTSPRSGGRQRRTGGVCDATRRPAGVRRGAQCGVDTDESGTRTVDEVPPAKADVAQFDTEPAEVSLEWFIHRFGRTNDPTIR